MSPTEGRGTYCFGADPVGVGVSVSGDDGVILSCLHDISWTGFQILTKFEWIKQLDMVKSWLGFADPDLIFKVTEGLKLPNLSQKVSWTDWGILTRYSCILH